MSIPASLPFTTLNQALKLLPAALSAGFLVPALAQDAGKLPDVLVTGTAPAASYLPDASVSVSRTTTPLSAQAAAIQVVPQAVLRDRNVTRTDQLIENVSGILPESTYGGNGATFFNIRGFSENNGLRDGFRNFGYLAFRDVQNIERVEVFKGPSGALYGGVGAVGGYVNTVSKQALSNDFTELRLTGGSYDQARTAEDVNRSTSPALRVRLNASAEHNNMERDHALFNSVSIAPALSWSVDADTSVTLLTEFNLLRRQGFDFGVPNIPDYKKLDTKRYYGLTDGMAAGVSGDFGRNDTRAVTAQLEHRFNETWTLRTAVQYTYARQQSTQTFPNTTTATDKLLDFTVYSGSVEESTQYGLRSELLGTVNLAGFQHQVLAGGDYGYLEQGSRGSRSYGLTLDLTAPSVQFPLTDLGSNASHQGQGRDLGIFIQDQVIFSPAWQASLALRADHFRNRALVAGSETSRESQSAWSPRLGLVWLPTAQTSVFADWSRSHAPNVGHGANENTFEAEVATQWEAGVKQQLFNNRLLLTLAAFRLERSNMLTTDPTDPTRQVLTGQQNSRGLELDLAGAITNTWKVMGSYSYTDAFVKRDGSLPTGDALTNVPRHHANLWSTWDLASLPGWGIGAGVYYVGAREATLPNSYKLSAYVRSDVAVFYRHNEWRVQLNVDNVLDRSYYTGGSASTFNYMLQPGAGRSARLSASYLF
ncbi:TonB-dependent receptor [Roseateles sp. SL47]|uniref:TonB-dependent receptor n=1 Tax=Roseateles sp. SL47 TaxID=2995138 RepID=UPI00226DA0B6|nr:TonB-dependent receptor [Roseateles sp. SL47]WAC73092.1 TonB-dependent receptor [Roseateles sp. SL47]